MIIDTGAVDSSVTFTNYIDDYVLARNNDNNIDYLVLSHSDNDHTGGALRLLKNYNIDTIYIPNVDGDANNYLDAKAYWTTNNYNTIYHSEEIIITGKDYKIEFFGPLSEDNTNDNCPIIKLSYLQYDFLFTGDISTEIESEFVSVYGDELDCDVLKVAHHGSKYSSSMEFLRIVTPKISVISCGKNSYGHPTDIALKNLNSVNSKILRTDLDGNILISANDLGMFYVTDDYMITNIIDYNVYLLVIDVLLLVELVIVIVKYKKTNNYSIHIK